MWTKNIRACCAAAIMILLSACGGGGGGGGDAGNGQYSIELDKNKLTFVTGVTPEKQSVTVTYRGDGVLIGVPPPATQLPEWLIVNAPQTSNNGVVVADILINKNEVLRPGTYSATLRFVSGKQDGSAVVSKDLLIEYTVSPFVELEKQDVALGGQWGGYSQAEHTVFLRSNLNWNVRSDQSWMELDKSQGKGSDSIKIKFDTIKLPIGDNFATLTVVSDDGKASDSLKIKYTQNEPKIEVLYPDNRTPYLVNNDVKETPRTYALRLGILGSIVSEAASLNWIVSPEDGVKAEVKESVLSLSYDVMSQALEPGIYKKQIKIKPDIQGWKTEEIVEFDLVVNPHRIYAYENGVAFSSVPGHEALAKTVKLSDSAGLTTGAWSAVSDSPWLKVDGIEGDRLSFHAVPDSLDEGMHYATLTVSSNGPRVENQETITVGLYKSSKLAVNGELTKNTGKFLAIDPIRPRAYFIDSGAPDEYVSNKIHAINTFTGEREWEFEFAEPINNILISSDGKTLYGQANSFLKMFRVDLLENNQQSSFLFNTGRHIYYARIAGYPFIYESNGGFIRLDSNLDLAGNMSFVNRDYRDGIHKQAKESNSVLIENYSVYRYVQIFYSGLTNELTLGSTLHQSNNYLVESRLSSAISSDGNTVQIGFARYAVSEQDGFVKKHDLLSSSEGAVFDVQFIDKDRTLVAFSDKINVYDAKGILENSTLVGESSDYHLDESNVGNVSETSDGQRAIAMVWVYKYNENVGYWSMWGVNTN